MTASHTILQHHPPPVSRSSASFSFKPANPITSFPISILISISHFPFQVALTSKYKYLPANTTPTVKETPQLIRTLCSGTPAQQLAALDANFTHDASFRHTICRVPSFGDVNVPLLGAVNSRWAIGCIYRWYKVLSPRIEVDIESVGM
jgi:hypothetical protein